jgi:hypothetical protein
LGCRWFSGGTSQPYVWFLSTGLRDLSRSSSAQCGQFQRPVAPHFAPGTQGCGPPPFLAERGPAQGRVPFFSLDAGRPLGLDEVVYRSESETGHRNRAIGHLLRNFDILTEPPDPVVDLYFKQCSVAVTCRDLAVMAATLASQSVIRLRFTAAEINSSRVRNAEEARALRVHGGGIWPRPPRASSTMNCVRVWPLARSPPSSPCCSGASSARARSW